MSAMGRATVQRDDDQYSDEEAQHRFLAAVKAGLNTPPKPRKSMTPKDVPAQSKKREKNKRQFEKRQ
jgi:hypothetical protein